MTAFTQKEGKIKIRHPDKFQFILLDLEEKSILN
jgi:hypothetical protein